MKEKLFRERLNLSIEDIPSEWTEILEFINREENARLIIVGSVDSGKSTLASYLLYSCSKDAYLLEADPGQPSYGIPGVISLVDKRGEARYRFFTGEITPIRNVTDLLLGIKLLSDRAIENCLILDTSGYVSGESAVRLKIAKSMLARCNTAVLIEREAGELKSFERLMKNLGMKVYVCPVSQKVRSFSQTERIYRRNNLVKEYFSKSDTLVLKLEKEKVFGVENFYKNLKKPTLAAFEDRNLLCLAPVLVYEVDDAGVYYRMKMFIRHDEKEKIENFEVLRLGRIYFDFSSGVALL